MAHVLAIVSKAVFDKELPRSKPGDRYATQLYRSTHKGLDVLASGGDLWLVTVHAGALWLVARLRQPQRAKDGWHGDNAVAITDISRLDLRFASGKGLPEDRGKFAMALQTPRALTDADVALLERAAGAPATPTSWTGAVVFDAATATVELPARWSGPVIGDVVQQLAVAHAATLERLVVKLDDKDAELGPVATAIGQARWPALRELVIEAIGFTPSEDVAHIAPRTVADHLARATSALRKLELRGDYFFDGFAHPTVRELVLVGLPLTEHALVERGKLATPALERLELELFADEAGAAIEAAMLAPIWAGHGLPALRELLVRGTLDGDVTFEMLRAAAKKQPPVTARLARLEIRGFDPNSALAHAGELCHLALDLGPTQAWLDRGLVREPELAALVAKLRDALPKLVIPAPPVAAVEDGLTDPRYQGTQWDKVWLYRSDVATFCTRAATDPVTAIVLEAYQLEVDDALAITRAVAGNRGVRKFQFECRDDFRHGPQGRTAEVIAALASAELTSLGLEYEALLDEPARARLGELVAAHPRLEAVALEGPHLGDAAVTAITSLPVLESIDLSNCDIKMAGAAPIADAIARSPSLKAIVLSENRINDQGICALLEAVRASGSVERLDVRANRPGKGATRLLRELKGARPRLALLSSVREEQ